MGWVHPLHRCPHMKMGVGLEVFRLSVWAGACEHDHDQPPCSSAPLQSIPAVASRRLPCGSRRGRWRHARGKSASDSSGGGCASGCGSRPPKRRSRRVPEVGDRSELRALVSGTRSFERVSRAEPGATEVASGSPTCPGAGGLARVFARTASTGHPGVHGRRVVSLAGAPPKRGDSVADVGRSRGRRSRDPLGARPSVTATRRWRLVFGRAGPEVAFRGDTDRGRGLHGRHAAGHPTTPSLGFVPFRRIQHGRS